MQIAAPNEDTSEMKMYVLVNRDILSLVQAGVQSCHAALEYSYNYNHLRTYNRWQNYHKTLIILEAKAYEINAKMLECEKINKTFMHFDEPDIGNRLTACCFEPMSSEEGKLLFGEFKLLS